MESGKVQTLGDELEPLAISPDGIEVMRHKCRLIYASQLYPEELHEGNDGLTNLLNFLSMIPSSFLTEGKLLFRDNDTREPSI